MSVIRKLRIRINQWQQKLLYKLVKTKIIGADKDKIELDPVQPVIYAMLYPSYAEQIVINKEVSERGWQAPFQQRLNGTLPGNPYFGIYRQR